MNKTIKTIDLLNKIANGEKVPKIIRYKNYDFEYHERLDNVCNYKVIGSDSKYLNDVFFIDSILNEEVEIIEDNDKIENNKIDNEEFLNIGKSFGEAYRTFFEGFKKGWESIEEKLDE